MAIVAVIGGTYCHQEEICGRAAERFGYDYMSNEKLVEYASELFQVSPKKLLRAMHQAPSVFNKFTYEKEQNIAYLRAALGEAVQKENLVYHGFASLLLPQSLTHVLRVCLVATSGYRIAEGGV